MTSEGYRAIIRSLGLVPCRPSHDGKTLHSTRDGDFQQVLDPEPLTPDERAGAIDLLKWRMGITDH